VIKERIDGLKFVFSMPTIKVFMIVTVILAGLMTAFKKTPAGQGIASLTLIYYVLLVNYYVISSLAGRYKAHWNMKKRFIISLVLAPILFNLLGGLYFPFLILGFIFWTFIEAYSFVAFSWDVTGRLKYVFVGMILSLIIVFVYSGYVSAKLTAAGVSEVISRTPLGSDNLAKPADIGLFDMGFSIFMFVYAFSKMGSRFVNKKRGSSEMWAVLIMIMTIGYVLSAQGPNKVGQIIYYGAKLFFIAVSVPLLLVVRSLKIGKRIAGRII
jgi:hypothetical protein